MKKMLDSLSISERILTPYGEVFTELERRRSDAQLLRKIADHVGSDIPEYFKHSPFLYLARHVATPNFETLRFLHLLEPLDMRIIISQDPDDKFASVNVLKHALGKLNICTKIDIKSNACSEIFQNINIIDFNRVDGKKIKDVNTVWGESLVSFHNSLFQTVAPKATFTICNEGEWLKNRFDADPLEYYKHLLPFFIAHGVLFEDFLFDDIREKAFLEEVILPAFTYVEETFGLKPLIASLVPDTLESSRFWIAYPHTVQKIVAERMAGIPQEIRQSREIVAG
jgi:hypothetical protein